MKKKNKQIGLAILFLSAVLFTVPAKAQVTVGAQTVPNSTLEVVALPTGATTADGIMAPRLTLAQINLRKPLYGTAQTGAMVYVTDVSGTTVAGYSDQITCTGLVFWNGANWVSNCAAPKNYAEIISQPKAFTFYEQGTETADALVFGAGGSSTMTYQWYKIVGNNINVRVSTPCVAADGSGITTNSFIPNVIKGTTNNAKNAGFYRYYCVAKNATNDSVVSIVAEVAVGCGAKDMFGNWISFMCFNLGATPQSMALQKSTSITLLPNGAVANGYFRSANERTLYGDLFQWGRIADGHEYRNAIQEGSTGSVETTDNCVAWNADTPPTYESGALLGIGAQPYPFQQVSRTDATYYGKFIKTINENSGNWYAGTNVNLNAVDLLWREAAFAPNDPCLHINDDGTTYSTFYPPASPSSTAGGTSGTGWRLPTQDEWTSLYRGKNISGNFSLANANTWSWYRLNPADANEGAKGYELKPEGVTATLFLPGNGYRNSSSAMLYSLGYGYYWSSSVLSVNAYNVYFDNGTVNPVQTSARGRGCAIRCVKN